MVSEKNRSKVTKKQKRAKKILPKNVFEIVGDAGQVIERVDPSKIIIKEKKKETEEKIEFSERTKKRRARLR